MIKNEKKNFFQAKKADGFLIVEIQKFFIEKNSFFHSAENFLY